VDASVPVTGSPSFSPSLQTVPVVSFTNALTFSGFETNTPLGDLEQSTITGTVCSAMGLTDTTACSYVGTVFTSYTTRRRQLRTAKINLLATLYTAVTTVAVQVPLTTGSTAETIRDSLAATLSTAVTSGSFATTLEAAGQENGVARVLQAVPTGVVTSVATVVLPPTMAPTTAPKDDSSSSELSTGAIVGIAVGGGVGLIIIIFLVWKFACASSSKVGVSN
jgi:hypothetical protein